MILKHESIINFIRNVNNNRTSNTLCVMKINLHEILLIDIYYILYKCKNMAS